MLKRVLWILVLVLALPVSLSQARTTRTRPVPPGLQVIRSDENGLVLELNTPDYERAMEILPGVAEPFDRLVVPGLDPAQEPGQPELVYKSVLLGVPPDAQLETRLVVDEVVSLPGRFRLIPSPRPQPGMEDFQPDALREVREADEAAYASDALYPSQAVRLTEAWLRDQRIARVELYPFQYIPATGELVWHRRLQVEIHFLPSSVRRVVKSQETQDSPFEPVLRQTLLNYEQARAWRARPSVETTSPNAAAAPTNCVTCYKIVVDHDGIYRVTYADLQAAGMDVGNIDPRTFRLTSQGQDVAVHVAGESDGNFDPGDYLTFYGQRFRGDRLAARHASEDDVWPVLHPANDGGLYGWQPHYNATMFEKYTDENVYWLTVGGTAGPRMGQVVGTPGGAFPVPDFYTATVHAEQRLMTWITNFTSEDIWFWNSVSASPSVTGTGTFTTVLTAVAPDAFTAKVRAEVTAQTFNNSASPDHRTQFVMNGTLIQDQTWDGYTRYRMEAPVAQSVLTEGVNSLAMNVILQPALTVDRIYFDWFEIDYARRFLAQGDQLYFSRVPTGTWQYQVGNLLTQTVEIYDVTNPLSPTRVLTPVVTVGGGTYTATFEITQTLGAQYFVAGATGVQSPKRLTRYAPPDLGSTNGADYIIITHGDFYTASQTLANYRAGQGLRVKVIDVQDLYNQFNDGILHSIAIKEFLRYAYANWQPLAPSYVVLVGDGHWNFKDYPLTGYVPTPIYMPPHLVWVDPWQGEVDSSSQLAAIVGNDILPDLHIGRIPVNSVAELNAVISKTIAYEQAGTQNWQRRALFVADNTPDAAGDFVAASEAAIAYVPGALQVDRIYLDNYCGTPTSSPCPTANYAITNTLNQTGSLLINYIGHAAPERWAHEQIFKVGDVASLTNTNRLPVVLSMTCLDGYWAHALVATRTSLMEAMLRASNGGMVGSFSPTGLGLMGGHDELDRAFLTAIFSNGVQRIGPAAMAAKLALYQTNNHLDLVHTFTIFGDPALRFPTYQLEMTPATAERSGLPGAVMAYSLQVTNTGLLTDTIVMTHTGNAWPVSLSTTIITLTPGSSAGVGVSATIPIDAWAGTTDTVKVTALSHGDATRVSSWLTTTALPIYRMSLTPDAVIQYGNPGAVVTYALQLTNTGNTSETELYTVTLGNHAWETVWRPTSLTLTTQTSAAIQVSVTIPVTALAGASDAVTVTVVSQRSGNGYAHLTTGVNLVRGLDLTPASLASSGQPGTIVTYTLQLTNTGNASDVYTMTPGSVWPALVYPTHLTLPAFAQVSLQVSVTVPVLTLAGSVNTTTLTVDSQNSGSLSSTLATTALLAFGITVLPDATARSGDPGALVHYLIELANTSNATDTYTVTRAGNAWATVVAPTALWLSARTSTTLQVTVTVPAAAMAGAADAVTVTITSEHNGYVPIQFTTTANAVYGFSLAPNEASSAGYPGRVVTYTLQLTNTGNATDAYTVTWTDNAWETHIAPTVLSLTAWTSTTIQISVTVPVTALAGMTDGVTVTITSAGNGSAPIRLTTATSAIYGINLSPGQASLSDYPGRGVTYTLQLTNVGNTTDTFHLDYTGNQWMVQLPLTTTTLLAGASQVVWVRVSVPAGLGMASDVVTVTATSQGNGAVASARLTTIRDMYKTFLPLVIK